MSNAPVRVRFAPSPTGYFHVGSARTALYNWLFARQSGGTFILRIEDTDTERNREEWVEGIYSALQWLGLGWDEGPYRQSEHRPHYDAAIDAILGGKHGYYCDCTRESLVTRHGEQAAVLGYDGHCRERGLGPGPGRALRFRVDPGGAVVVRDIIRGDVTFERSSIEDFVVVKASGDPLFVLANVVDDIVMGISHVIRGEDLLPTTPKGLLLWEVLAPALGPSEDTGGFPAFAHLPMLVNAKRQKLSKRRDPVAIEQYREEGYLPEVMVGYLALLGWSPKGDREIISLDEMIGEFRLEEVNHSPAFFDVEKLCHFNGEAIRAMDPDSFAEACRPWLGERAGSEIFRRMAPLVQTRVARLSEAPPMVDFLFSGEVAFDPASWEKAVAGNSHARTVLESVAASSRQVEWKAEAIKEAVAAAGEQAGLKLAKAQAPVRVALTGRTVGPPLFESMEILGREAVVARIEAALYRMSSGG